MTIDKDWKRLVRARMRKTGESYTAARAHLLRTASRHGNGSAAAVAIADAPARAVRPTPAPAAAAKPAPGDYARLAGMADATLKARTGCTWERWVGALDGVKAHEWPHGQIAAFVHEKFDVSGWWAQMVTTGYERIKGLRSVGQRRSGLWDANRSRTFHVAVAKVFRAFRDARTRHRWLGDVPFTVRTQKADKTMRVTWGDGRSVEIYFVGKGPKTQVSVQHTKLPDAAAVARSKAFWGARFDALAELLKAPGALAPDTVRSVAPSGVGKRRGAG